MTRATTFVLGLLVAMALGAGGCNAVIGLVDVPPPAAVDAGRPVCRFDGGAGMTLDNCVFGP